MSISASTPRITATPSSGRPNVAERAGEDDQRRARHGRNALAGEHQRQHHDELLAQRQLHARRLGHEHRRHREVERRAIEVERVAGGQHEGDDAARHAELLHVLEGERQRRLGRRGGEGDEPRLLDPVPEAPQRNAREQRDRDEHQQDERDERDVERAHQAEQVPQHPDAAVPHRHRHRGADADRREQHDQAGELEHHVGQPLEEPQHDVLRPARLHLRQRDGEEHGEDHDLEHFVPRGRVEEAGREGVLQHAGQRDLAAGELLALVGRRRREVDAVTGPEQVDGDAGRRPARAS